jgi:hypothetical protein
LRFPVVTSVGSSLYRSGLLGHSRCFELRSGAVTSTVGVFQALFGACVDSISLSLTGTSFAIDSRCIRYLAGVGIMGSTARLDIRHPPSTVSTRMPSSHRVPIRLEPIPDMLLHVSRAPDLRCLPLTTLLSRQPRTRTGPVSRAPGAASSHGSRSRGEGSGVSRLTEQAQPWCRRCDEASIVKHLLVVLTHVLYLEHE